jgi:hypothetical protein
MGRPLQPGVDKIPESWVKDKVKDILDHYDELHWDMPPASEFGTAGRHDFTICQNGCFWTIETKAGKNKPTELQINYAVDIAKAGGISLKINELNLDEVRKVCAYIHTMHRIPVHMAHDFTRWRKDASKKRGARHVGAKPGVDHSSNPDS